MIKKISIKEVASYGSTPAILETDTNKKINLMYGLNGSGKTIFSTYLQNREHDDYSHCSIDGLNNEKILVYNHNFIKQNFYEQSEQKGIFTLSEGNKVAEEKISKANSDIKELNLQLQSERSNLISNNEEKKELQRKTENETWKIRTQNAQHRVFDENGFFDKPKATKAIIFNSLMETALVETTKPIEEIITELQALGGEAQNMDQLTTIDSQSFSNTEQNNIFKEAIIGNENSSVAELIVELKNSDWVKQGLRYVDLQKRDNCPFCQQETLTDKLVKQIKDYFDATYEDRIQYLKNLQKSYQSLKDNFKLEDYKKDFFNEKEHIEIKDLFHALNGILDQNLLSIKSKVDNPSITAELHSSQNTIEDVNHFTNKINGQIREFNNKLKNREQTIEKLKEEFWKNQRKEHNGLITEYQQKDGTLQTKAKGIQKKAERLDGEISAQDKIIVGAEKDTTNITGAINNINKELAFFGAVGFQIVKTEKNFYKLERTGELKGSNFETLSEGEKTIISFLYFLELCKGKETRDELSTEKIIVIDDPISSLSHMYIFNVAQLIRHNFFGKDDGQIFILTHNLYFFHELLHPESQLKHKKLFRIIKSQNNESNISDMKKNEIQNDYQAYWQIIKDCNEGKGSKALLPNAMRNIFEHFFNFMNKDVSKILPKYYQKEYAHFIRYMNRESHSDVTNISDIKEIDPEIFNKAFKEIFEKEKYSDHYKKMMSDTVDN